MKGFDWKLAVSRWVLGALTPVVAALGAMGTTGAAVDWRAVGMVAFGGFLSAVVVDLNAFLRSAPAV